MIHLDLLPSQDDQNFWHYVIRDMMRDRHFGSSDQTGKWMIFLDKKDLDKSWEIIKKAARDDLLGPACKCSTARENPSQRDMESAVIVCYTENFNDTEDVEKVYRNLRKLGFKGELKYKKDSATKAGIYGDKSWHIVRPEARDL